MKKNEQPRIMGKLNKSTTIALIMWTLLGGCVDSSQTNDSLDPAPGRSPGPPTPTAAPTPFDRLATATATEEQQVTRRYDESNQGKNNDDDDDGYVKSAVGSSLSSPCGSSTKRANSGSYVQADENLVNVVPQTNDGAVEVVASSVTTVLLLDVIHDVFDTTNEPLVPELTYKGKFLLLLLLSCSLDVVYAGYIHGHVAYSYRLFHNLSSAQAREPLSVTG